MAGGEVRYRLVADASAFSSGLRTASREFETFGKTIMAGVGLGAGFSVGEKAAEALMDAMRGIPALIASSTEAAIGYASAIQDASERTRVGVEELQALKIAAEAADVDFPALQAGLTKMEQAIGKDSDAFRRLGLDLDQLRKMSPDQALLATGKALAGIKDAGTQAALGAAIFGKSWSTYLTLFQSDAAGAMQKARDLGLVMSKDMVAALESLGDKVGLLKSTWEGLWINFGAGIASSPGAVAAIDAITDGVGALSKAVQDNQAEIAAWTTSGIDAMAEGLKVLTDAAIGAVIVFGDLKAGAEAVASPFVAAAAAIDAVVSAAKRLKEVGPMGMLMGAGSGANAPAKWSGLSSMAGGMVGPTGVSLMGSLPGGVGGLAGLLQMAMFGAAQGSTASAQGSPGISILDDFKRRVEALQAAIRATSSEPAKRALDTIAGAAKEAADEIAKTAKALHDFNIEQDAAEAKRMASSGLLDPKNLGQFPMPELGTESGALPPRSGLVEEEYKAMLARVKQAQLDAYREMGEHLMGLSGVFGALSQTMAAFGVSADSLAARVVADFGAMAQAGAKIAEGLASGNPLAVAGGVIGGIGAVAGLLGDIFGGGESAAEKAARAQGEAIGRALGHAVTAAAQEAITADAAKLTLPVSLAALLHITDSGGSAEKFAPQIIGLMAGIAAGAIPAARGVAEVGKAFSEFASSAVAGTGEGYRQIAAIIEMAERSGVRVKEIQDYVMSHVQAGVAALGSAFDYLSGQIGTTQAEMDVFGLSAVAMFDKLRKAGFGLTDALGAMAGVIERAVAAYEKLGLEAPKALRDIAGLAAKVADNKALVDLASHYGALFDALPGMSEEQFRGLETGLAGIADKLRDAGFGAEEMASILGPALAAAKKHADALGIPLSKDVQALYDAAAAAGELGDSSVGMSDLNNSMMTMNVLLAGIAEKFGVTIPAGIEAAIAAWLEFNKVGGATPRGPDGPAGPPAGDDGARDGPAPPPSAKGGWVTRPQVRLVGEAGPELIAPERALHGFADAITQRVERIVAAAGRGSSDLTIHNLSVSTKDDPREFASRFVRAVRDNWRDDDGVGVRTALDRGR